MSNWRDALEVPGEADWPCDMRYQPPYDFAWCETHDMTFALGGVCPFEQRRKDAARGEGR